MLKCEISWRWWTLMTVKYGHLYRVKKRAVQKTATRQVTFQGVAEVAARGGRSCRFFSRTYRTGSYM